jgi:hypothetical protein
MQHGVVFAADCAVVAEVGFLILINNVLEVQSFLSILVF